ncbi:MAG: flagellar basal body P-ring formation chaperone FlgA, partial [Desulfobulbaceae bacterium]|nr:flagellar basal body P-ring formation chaperone FlgA [Desulfobulbaceae bacterium]
AMLILACLLQARMTTAAVLTTAAMKGIFRELTCANAPWPKEQLVVADFNAQPATLTLPDGTIGYRTNNQPHPNYLGRKALTIAILVDGKEAATVRMTGDLHLYGEIACTTRRIGRHELLTAKDIKMLRRDITTLGDDLVRQPTAAIGKRLTTALQPGDILRTTHLDEPPLVNRGDMVTIVVQTPGLRASAPGEAKKTGGRGDIIRVKNLMSRKYILAKVIDAGVVRAEF